MNAPSRIQVPILDLDLLRTLVAIAETGSFSAAAEVVLRTPSAVSMQVKRMEELLDRPLFVRDSRSVTLTQDGEAVLIHARRMLALNRDLVGQFIAPDVAGVVRLGAPDDFAERVLPHVLTRFSQSHPGVTVNVVIDGSAPMIDMVRAGDLDMAVVTCMPGVADVEPLATERLVWAGLKCGIAGEKNPVPVSVWEESCAWRQVGLSALKEIGRDYRVAYQSAHIGGQRAAILADLAIAPIPVSCLTEDIVDVGAKLGFPPLGEYQLGLFKTDNLSVAGQAAADHMRATLAQLG